MYWGAVPVTQNTKELKPDDTAEFVTSVKRTGGYEVKFKLLRPVSKTHSSVAFDITAESGKSAKEKDITCEIDYVSVNLPIKYGTGKGNTVMFEISVPVIKLVRDFKYLDVLVLESAKPLDKKRMREFALDDAGPAVKSAKSQ